MLPLNQHPTTGHAKPGDAAPVANFVADKSVFVVDVPDYERQRSMLYALGAKGVANKMMAHVNLILHGGATPPKKAQAKYPKGEFVRASALLPLFHQEIRSFAGYIKALQGHGFQVRNPSDEGDPDFDFFELPLVDGSLHATLLGYLASSPFIRGFVGRQSFPIDRRDEGFVDFELPGREGLTWYYAWHRDAWSRVSAQRGEGDYPLEIRGSQLMAVEPLLWTESTGLYFYEYPNADSVTGLFIQAGIDARSGQVHGAAISRVWT
ncbi:MAG: hypothetical protein KC420_10400 [Myxococcales bacterium]|nr:hypothetical protein [Myxococcales bacterium]MCB9566403.1 hypothetical protein [Myxococcales bacterium]MCB9705741.1 hypothetical protein [Myxococcales bacterium]